MDNRIINYATDEERQADMQAVLTLMRLSEMDHQMAQGPATRERESAAAEGIFMMSRAAVASPGSFPDGPRLLVSEYVSR